MPMQICINYGGHVHCHYVPELQIPVKWYIPTPGPVNYPAFLSDAMIWNTVQALTESISDEKVRHALQTGLAGSLRAMQQHAGADVEIRVAGLQG